jgi:acyl carrier protein
MSSTGAPITLDEFRRLIARELHVDESRVKPEASFVDDLHADSIRLVEMMLQLKQKGITIPMDEAWNVKTVGDAYQVYSRHVGNASGGISGSGAPGSDESGSGASGSGTP